MMKKLKKFQKFALSAEQASKVKGGITCHAENGFTLEGIPDWETAAAFCAAASNCVGCF